jgi:polysaccharide export outer membrane protein
VIYRPAILLSLCGALLLAACAGPVTKKVLPIKGSAPAAVRSYNYKLAPNDVLSISVYQQPDMTTQQQVARDGTISFPLVGRVIVGGLTIEEAQAAIAKRLSDHYLVNPQVTIVISQYAPQNYTILGQVGAPGAYPIPYDETTFTLPMAVARAGGNTRIGNLRNVRVTRRDGNSVVQYTVNMLSSDGQQFPIQPGDLITVQETLF